MKAHFVKAGALCIAATIAVPAGALAQQGPTAFQLELRASADSAKAQQLARVAPSRASAYLRRSRAELEGAYRKTAARSQAHAAAMTRRLRNDARSTRDLALESSGALAVKAAGALERDIQIEGHLAAQTPRRRQAAAIDAGIDMTNTALGGLHRTPARGRAVRHAFARAVAAGLELGRSLAHRAASEGTPSSETGRSRANDLLARLAAWSSSVSKRLQSSADGETTVDAPVSGAVTLSALAGSVAAEANCDSSTFSTGVRGQVAQGWDGLLP